MAFDLRLVQFNSDLLTENMDNLENLLKEGVNVEGFAVLGPSIPTPLFTAATQGKLSLVRLLLRYKANVNWTFQGNGPLLGSIMSANIGVSELPLVQALI